MSNRDDIEIPRWLVTLVAAAIRIVPLLILLTLTNGNPWILVAYIVAEITSAFAEGFTDAAAHERSRQRLLEGWPAAEARRRGVPSDEDDSLPT